MAVYIKGGWYMTVEELRKKYGYRTTRTLYARLNDGKIDGAVEFDGRWLVPTGAIITDGRIKHGRYIKWRERYPQQHDEK